MLCMIERVSIIIDGLSLKSDSLSYYQAVYYATGAYTYSKRYIDLSSF